VLASATPVPGRCQTLAAPEVVRGAELGSRSPNKWARAFVVGAVPMARFTGTTATVANFHTDCGSQDRFNWSTPGHWEGDRILGLVSSRRNLVENPAATTVGAPSQSSRTPSRIHARESMRAAR
jgi:hypothetical protein